jgi:Cu/Ag efflux protein CusF
MKKILILMVALLTLIAFTGGAVAQAPAKTEKPAAAPEKAAPAPAAEKPKVEKPKAVKSMKASGTVAAYEEGKMITVKGAKNKEWTFDVTPDTKLKGEIKEGAKVTVTYKKEGNKMVASAISVAKAKKKTASKK